MNTKDHFFGEVAIALSLLGRDDVERVIRLQKRRPKATIGQLCRQLGLLTESQVERVLSEQKRILERRRTARAERQQVVIARAQPKPRRAHKPQPVVERARPIVERRREPATEASEPPSLADELAGAASPARRATPPARPAPAPTPSSVTAVPGFRRPPRPSTPTSDRHGDLLGRLAVDSGMLTMDQLGVLTRQQGRQTGKLIGELLVEKGYATREQIDELLATQRQLRSRTQELQAIKVDGSEEAGSEETGSDEAGRGEAGRGEAGSEEIALDPNEVSLPECDADAPLTTDASSMTAEIPIPVETHRRPAAELSDTQPVLGKGAGSTSEPLPADADAPKLEPPRDLDGWLERAVDRGATDVLLHAGAPVKLRHLGELHDLGDEPLADALARPLLLAALDDGKRAQLERTGELDFAYASASGRFRANIYEDQRGLCGVFHYIPAEPPTLHDLDLPSELAKVVNVHQGLVLISGPAGCGKTSTLAALVNILNEERSEHILTAEDPVEYLHRSKSCLVNQRQVHRDTASFSQALRAALREDPDVICIGELRDLETISLALSAAETGHLVLATMHNASAIRAINSLVGAYPPEQQPQVRTMLSESLRAVVAQRLLPRKDGDGMALALELLLVNRAVSNLIRENRTFQLGSVLQMGKAEGMRMLDHSLAELVERNVITAETARAAADNPESFAAPSGRQ